MADSLNTALFPETSMIFERTEKKYIFDEDKAVRFMELAAPHIMPDIFPSGTNCTLYFDTPDWKVIRRSMEGPVYKEKLRLRTYCEEPDDETPVYLELKKKYKGVVYKRRTAMTNAQANSFIYGGAPAPEDTQIMREIQYFMQYYGDLAPRIYIAYDRKSYAANDGSEFRMTMDNNIVWRDKDLHLSAGRYGEELFSPGVCIAELKIPDAMPLWLAKALDISGALPASVSKYAAAYTALMQRGKTNSRRSVYIEGGVYCA